MQCSDVASYCGITQAFDTSVSITPKERLEQHFETRGYDHLAVVPDQEGFPEPLEQIAQYVKNPHQFDEAVAEFAKFTIENCEGDLCQFACSLMPSVLHLDQWGEIRDATYLILAATSVGNYGSFPLYIEQGKGKIGIKNPEILLVDNPNLGNPVTNVLSQKYEHTHIDQLFKFFPFHKKIILEVLREIHPSVDVNTSSLNKTVEDQKAILKSFSECHSLMLKTQNSQS